ncbi:hypothetical protein BRDID11004_59680 [Bradyrhizobium diazoefficiens]|uniref:Ribbon-helix-helix protein CopG domain-containing protein n=1 Tax=Bradyrhizobium diazoefficiens TaxID=1355477 RepID=A0A810AM99_9BRAD|nr:MULTISPECIES: hypothetical protein [Bradyrhizobium]WLB66060.1 hypothetical protein QIH96_13210 [Bradyrhizobium japonicum]BBZ93133.1 hypothetical protein F07S3_29660 [Bradyrhizobium diazoefficiens]BCA10884.1 hypothetical protein BDHF08_27310 [Bradyrhizobium diazoefficiens]BCE55219.1 hypothetical protein XF5B_27310 [Bradyrhizobium diazoefficiens]BCE63953.1 hypothetical protein XF6B_27520 [Bradyrhizobium diazoefficiens]
MRRKINTAFDDHDYEQLQLLAAMNKIRLTELVRRIVQAHLDKRKVNLREDR